MTAPLHTVSPLAPSLPNGAPTVGDGSQAAVNAAARKAAESLAAGQEAEKVPAAVLALPTGDGLANVPNVVAAMNGKSGAAVMVAAGISGRLAAEKSGRVLSAARGVVASMLALAIEATPVIDADGTGEIPADYRNGRATTDLDSNGRPTMIVPSSALSAAGASGVMVLHPVNADGSPALVGRFAYRGERKDGTPVVNVISGYRLCTVEAAVSGLTLARKGKGAPEADEGKARPSTIARGVSATWADDIGAAMAAGDFSKLPAMAQSYGDALAHAEAGHISAAMAETAREIKSVGTGDNAGHVGKRNAARIDGRKARLDGLSVHAAGRLERAMKAQARKARKGASKGK